MEKAADFFHLQTFAQGHIGRNGRFFQYAV